MHSAVCRGGSDGPNGATGTASTCHSLVRLSWLRRCRTSFCLPASLCSFCLPQFTEVRVLQSLSRNDAIIRIVFKQLLHQIGHLGTCMRYQTLNSSATLLRKVKIHVGSVALELTREHL